MSPDDERLPATRRQALKVGAAAVGTGVVPGAAAARDADDAGEIDPEPERVEIDPDSNVFAPVVETFDSVSRVHATGFVTAREAAEVVRQLPTSQTPTLVVPETLELTRLGWPHSNRLAGAVADGEARVVTVPETAVSEESHALVVGQRDGQTAAAWDHWGRRQWVVVTVPGVPPAASDETAVTRDVSVPATRESRVRQALDAAPDAVVDVFETMGSATWRAATRPSAELLAGWGFGRADDADGDDAVAWARRAGVGSDLVRRVFDAAGGLVGEGSLEDESRLVATAVCDGDWRLAADNRGGSA